MHNTTLDSKVTNMTIPVGPGPGSNTWSSRPHVSQVSVTFSLKTKTRELEIDHPLESRV